MGITMNMICLMDNLNMLKPNLKVLDIGSSNLYSATEEQITDIVTKYASLNINNEKVKKLSDGSYYDNVHGGRNEAWAGELFELMGYEYISIDIAKGYNTYIHDFNKDIYTGREGGSEHFPLKKYFNLVLNFGTSEHILNQKMIFELIHNMTDKGGYMIHQLPMCGYLEHGYFTYTPRFFMELAQTNHYKIIWLDISIGEKIKTDSYLQSLIIHYPELQKVANEQYKSITIIYQKMDNKDFKCNYELSTSVYLK